MIQLLDTTIRDGSYVIDFQFSAHDTTAIAARLDDAGVHYIETGHGLGLGAGIRPEMLAADTDDKYLEASRRAVKNNKWGMFFIPGIGSLEDIERAAAYGMDFIRIGTNVTEVELSQKYIDKAKKLGMMVFANYMKTYAADAATVGQLAKQSADYGADVVCVVDSAGGMMPDEVKAYVEAVRKNIQVLVGFHGHNNLGMSVSNSLIAVDAGADIIDTSVRGMGRSAGNTVTEMFLFAMKRRNQDLGIDTTKILNLAEKIIDPFMLNYKQVDSIGVISGYAQFHSSFQGKVFKCASKHQIDPRELIIKLTENDRVNAPDELLESLAKEIKANTKTNAGLKVEQAEVKVKEEHADLLQHLTSIVSNARSAAKKWGKSAVLNLSQVYGDEHKASSISSSLHENASFVMGSGAFSCHEKMDDLLEVIDNHIEYVLLDIDNKFSSSATWVNQVRTALKKAKVLPYSDIQAWAESISQFIVGKLDGNLVRKNVLVIGNSALSQSICSCLEPFGAVISNHNDGKANVSVYDVVICCEAVEGNWTEKVGANTLIVDGLIGALNELQLLSFQKKGINIYRPEMIHVILSKLESLKSNMFMISEKQGYAEVNATKIAAGGIVVPEGTVIVDSVKHPTKVFGVANGKGMLIQSVELSPEHLRSVKQVEDWILTQILN